MMNDFCNWTDANAFMLACFAGGGIDAMEQRDTIRIAQRLESPLELVMLCALKFADKAIRFHDQADEIIREMRLAKMLSIDLQAAVPVGAYRADLVMAAKVDGESYQPSPVVIECDGFNYHDRTREQACHDRARDRYMQRQGYVVARFAGDEIVQQPFACAFDAFDLALRGIARVDRDAHPAGGWPVFIRRNDGADRGPMSLDDYDLTLSGSQVA